MELDKVRIAAKLLTQAQDILSGGPLEYYLTELAAAHDLLMTRYAPFKVGDRVRLKAAPEITESVRPGWMHYKTLLVAGALGVVSTASCGSRGFVFDIIFDADERKAKFAFNEYALEKESE
jgi:hypothetical protein